LFWSAVGAEASEPLLHLLKQRRVVLDGGVHLLGGVGQLVNAALHRLRLASHRFRGAVQRAAQLLRPLLVAAEELVHMPIPPVMAGPGLGGELHVPHGGQLLAHELHLRLHQRERLHLCLPRFAQVLPIRMELFQALHQHGLYGLLGDLREGDGRCGPLGEGCHGGHLGRLRHGERAYANMGAAGAARLGLEVHRRGEQRDGHRGEPGSDVRLHGQEAVVVDVFGDLEVLDVLALGVQAVEEFFRHVDAHPRPRLLHAVRHLHRAAEELVLGVVAAALDGAGEGVAAMQTDADNKVVVAEGAQLLVEGDATYAVHHAHRHAEHALRLLRGGGVVLLAHHHVLGAEGANREDAFGAADDGIKLGAHGVDEPHLVCCADQLCHAGHPADVAHQHAAVLMLLRRELLHTAALDLLDEVLRQKLRQHAV